MDDLRHLAIKRYESLLEISKVFPWLGEEDGREFFAEVAHSLVVYGVETSKWGKKSKSLWEYKYRLISSGAEKSFAPPLNWFDVDTCQVMSCLRDEDWQRGPIMFKELINYSEIVFKLIIDRNERCKGWDEDLKVKEVEKAQANFLFSMPMQFEIVSSAIKKLGVV